MRNFNVDVDYSSWWYGNVVATNAVDLTEEDYNEAFSGYTSYNMAKSLIDGYKDEASEAMPMFEANEWICDEIKDDILSGNGFGTVRVNDAYIDWELLYSESGRDNADFFNLTEESQEHIVNAILNDCCKQGELNESIYCDVEISADGLVRNDDGSYEGSLHISISPYEGGFEAGYYDVDFKYSDEGYELGAIPDGDDLYDAVINTSDFQSAVMDEIRDEINEHYTSKSDDLER